MSISPLLNTGIYPLPRAARLIGANPRAVSRWMHGYQRKGQDGLRRTTAPLWKTQLADEDFSVPAVGFRDLMELRFVNAFVQAGVSLHVIKATIDSARGLWKTDYPLTLRRFRTDGKVIFESAVNESGDEVLTDVRKRQVVFTHIIKPALYAGIQYDGDVAVIWHPQDAKGIVLDPAQRFGAPVVTGTGITTDTLFATYEAEGRDRKTTARIFEIDPQQVDAAVRFEERLRA